ncbi:MAG: hypothetical protein OHK93_005932 [Ramalina farinacea]|uniref:Ecp2 effector protein domain-containing protein n=1 Tax=Ramalina farinacea TaxID=258253 RepID=A0AA43QHL3_9LECA|nr:hypothetical protein [Ramalina farinacea]
MRLCAAPLLTALLLLLSTPNPITSTTTNPLPSTNLTNPPPPSPQHPSASPLPSSAPPPLYTDCTALLSLILSNAASRRLREFTLHPPPSQSDWQVPSTFYHGTCRLTLSPLIILEWSSFAEIAEQGLEAVEKCLGPEVQSGRYAAGFNVAGLGEGLGVYLHGDVRVGGTGTGVDVAKRQGSTGSGGGQSCGRVDEGKVVDLQRLGGGWMDGAGAGAAAPGEQGLVSTTKKKKRRRK